MESIHLEVRGQVQGVGFRWFVVEQAKRLGVAGWVRNNRDGSVEIAAAGQRETLARLESAVRTGPRGARVDEVRTLGVVSPESLPKPFEISR